MTALSVLGGLLLLVLPGAWLGFGIALPGASFRVRLALAAILSPPVLLGQFYLLRWAGLGFQPTTIALAVINLPALLVAYRSGSRPERPSVEAVLTWSVPTLLIGAYLAIWTGDTQVRGNWGHAWLHADIVYLIANGQLRPEEPVMAGLALAYPWGGHVVQAVISALLDSAPSSSFMLVNLTTLVASIALIGEMIAVIGGSRIAQAGGALLLAFGLNYVGPFGERLVPKGLQQRYPIWGDSRYEIWFRKFGVFQQAGLAIAMAVAIAALSIDTVVRGFDRSRVFIIAVLLLSLAVIYPLLWPAAALPVCAALLILAIRVQRDVNAPSMRELVALAFVLALGFATTEFWTKAVFVDRGDPSTMAFTTIWGMKVKAATAFVALFPLWTTALFGARTLLRTNRSVVVVLALSFLGSLALNVGLKLAVANEYKFMFTTALFLAPLSAIGLEELLNRAPRAQRVMLVAFALVIGLPPIYFRSKMGPNFSNAPRTDFSHFETRLQSGERGAGVLDAVRRQSPGNAVVVAEWEPFDLVTLTERPLYVLATQKLVHGLGVDADGLLKQFRGYSMALVRERRDVVHSLYAATADSVCAGALDTIRHQMKRPLVVLVRYPEDTRLDAWLARQRARKLASSTTEGAWLISADAVVAQR